MTHSHFRLLIPLALFLLSSCTRPPAVDTPTLQVPTSTPGATALATARPLHAAEIKFALVGSLNDANVWALFDSKGYSYNDYAVRSEYWPRLYHLTIPEGYFEPQAAAGMPFSVQQEGAFYTATVPLRQDLKWTDGAPFTADDVAFTVNTALSFQLGFDWRAYYDPAWFDHAEALNAHLVKFFFKKVPNVAVWQYGALQGPVVQKSYWAPKLTDSSALLPTPADLAKIESLSTQEANLQKSIHDLIAAGAAATGEAARQLQAQLRNQQSNLDGVRNDLAKSQGAVDASMNAARQSLYSVEAFGEPTLGTWIPAGQSGSTWTNTANPSHPFGAPNFDRAVYTLYSSEYAAFTALRNGDVNSILENNGVSPDLTVSIFNAHLGVTDNRSSSAYFLVINPAGPGMTDATIRRALFCSIARAGFARQLEVLPLVSFVLDNSFWTSTAANGICGTENDSLSFDPQKGVAILKAAGYSWGTEPAGVSDGSGLKQPNGEPFPAITLLAPSQQDDPQTAWASQWVAKSAQHLGIPVNIRSPTPAEIRYAVFNDHKYDMAIVGWQLSAYPGYLCEWFGDGNPFGYDIPQVRADCAALNTTSDLDAARGLVFDIQSVLAQEPPFIPLFSGITYDATRGIVYPFAGILNGLSGVYGAPSVAIPSSP